ncbi:uncharacterized protein IL334_004165 [Kwoniella shivajii]|uniref:Uncharacterized protein n=1 Tax=Kwoniella shivajii TaxID=564305 RepID=A0ABZ1D0X9_9TREE|nr:hypothetical protein IL334_004165 [Kwoniella shivajii]
MLSTVSLLSLAVLLGATDVAAQRICYDGYGRRYYCNNGLAWGARLGIGLGVAALVLIIFALCGFWRRKQLRNQFSKYKPPALPYTGNDQNGQNPYANNPPPPTGQAGSYYNNSSYNGNPYGNSPAPPAQTYQPSMAGQYTGATNNNQTQGNEDNEHGYEWEQARENERLEREQANGGANANANAAPAPPGYDIATSTHNTGTTNSTHYQPPAGPPPGKTH